jgi:hypothetical protein
MDGQDQVDEGVEEEIYVVPNDVHLYRGVATNKPAGLINNEKRGSMP